jgi:hypothetical protein
VGELAVLGANDDQVRRGNLPGGRQAHDQQSGYG